MIRKGFLIVLFLLVSVSANAMPIQWIGNGHYYEFIPFTASALTWHESLSMANTLSYMGLDGYMATITSAEENAFLISNFFTGQSSQFAWIAGHEPNDDVIWIWAAGPEAGQDFTYTNWGGIEPNDNKPFEDYAMFNIGTTFSSIEPGQWADAEPWTSGSDPVVGYFVEYGGQGEVIPEPATMILFGIGLTGLAFRRRK